MTSGELFNLGKTLMESQRLEQMSKEELKRSIEMAREFLYDVERGKFQCDEATIDQTEKALYEYRDRLKTLEILELETSS